MPRCHSCLIDIPQSDSFCDDCRKTFGASAVLQVEEPEVIRKLRKQAVKNSMQGMQDKVYLQLSGNKWNVVEIANATHLLKLLPERSSRSGYKYLRDTPANEHLSMQLGQKIFGIPIALNAYVWLLDSGKREPAYLTALFNATSENYSQEDLVQLAQQIPESKYDFSYERLAAIIRDYSTQTQADVEIFFKMLVLDIAIKNGDAHARNFSMLSSFGSDSTRQLAPMYDVLNTKLHIDDDTLACRIFEKGNLKKYNDITKNKILELALKVDITPQEATQIIDTLCQSHKDMFQIIDHSFLTMAAKSIYKKHIRHTIGLWCGEKITLRRKRKTGGD